MGRSKDRLRCSFVHVGVGNSSAILICCARCKPRRLMGGSEQRTAALRRRYRSLSRYRSRVRARVRRDPSAQEKRKRGDKETRRELENSFLKRRCLYKQDKTQ